VPRERAALIGIIVALVNILGVIGQTVFGGMVDKSERIDEKTFVAITMGATVVLSLALVALPTASILMLPAASATPSSTSSCSCQRPRS